MIAIGAIHALTERGRSVPDEVSVIGYDDTPQGTPFLPALSTVRQNWRDGGVLLARKMLGLLRGEAAQSETLPTALVIRAT